MRSNEPKMDHIFCFYKQKMPALVQAGAACKVEINLKECAGTTRSS